MIKKRVPYHVQDDRPFGRQVEADPPEELPDPDPTPQGGSRPEPDSTPTLAEPPKTPRPAQELRSAQTAEEQAAILARVNAERPDPLGEYRRKLAAGEIVNYTQKDRR